MRPIAAATNHCLLTLIHFSFVYDTHASADDDDDDDDVIL